jgi:hypothetical protein
VVAWEDSKSCAGSCCCCCGESGDRTRLVGDCGGSDESFTVLPSGGGVPERSELLLLLLEELGSGSGLWVEREGEGCDGRGDVVVLGGQLLNGGSWTDLCLELPLLFGCWLSSLGLPDSPRLNLLRSAFIVRVRA